jgi:hypothetical protein
VGDTTYSQRSLGIRIAVRLGSDIQIHVLLASRSDLVDPGGISNRRNVDPES